MLGPSSAPPDALQYAISPAPPQGLSLNAATGVVSGTPTVASRSTTYNITCSTRSGEVAFFCINLFVGATGEAADLIVHPDPTDPSLGWIADRSGKAVYGSRSESAGYPFQRAIELAPLGGLVRVEKGRIAGFASCTDDPRDYILECSHTLNTTQEHPLIVVGDSSGGTQMFSPLDGPTGGALLRWFNRGFGHVHFKNLVIQPTWIGASIGGSAKGPAEDNVPGMWFVDCEIDGRYDYYNCPDYSPVEGPGGAQCGNTKWGVMTYGVADFRWVRGRIHDIGKEHAFYMHTTKGFVLIHNATLERVGRTCIQTCNDAYDPFKPASDETKQYGGVGPFYFDGNTCTDSGLGIPDDHHGGSGYTVRGGHHGRVVLRRNTFRAGFDIPLKKAIINKTRYSSVYGTGAVSVWKDPAACKRNQRVELIENDFAMASDSGDRALIVLSGVNDLVFKGNRVAPGRQNNAIDVNQESTNNDKCGPQCDDYPLHGENGWIPDGGFRFACDNQIIDGKTTYEESEISDMCHNPCCTGKVVV